MNNNNNNNWAVCHDGPMNNNWANVCNQQPLNNNNNNNNNWANSLPRQANEQQLGEQSATNRPMNRFLFSSLAMDSGRVL